MSEDLKACPFACKVDRGPAVEVDLDEWDVARVICRDCGSAGPFVDITAYSGGIVDAAKSEAIRLWNARTALNEMGGESVS